LGAAGLRGLVSKHTKYGVTLNAVKGLPMVSFVRDRMGTEPYRVEILRFAQTCPELVEGMTGVGGAGCGCGEPKEKAAIQPPK
jgi:hypothetical protein